MIIDRYGTFSRPGRGARIDWSHPLAQGLVAAWHFSEQHGPTTYALGGPDAGWRSVLTDAGASGGMWRGSAMGGGLLWTAANQWLSWPLDPRLQVPLPLTMIVILRVDSLAAYRPIFLTGGRTTTFAGAMLGLTTGGTLELVYGANTGANGNTDRRLGNPSTTITTSQRYHIAGAIRGATDMSLRVNGVAQALSYSGSGGAMAYNTAVAGAFGGWNLNSTASTFSGLIDSAWLYRVALSETQLIWHAAEPWAMMATRRRLVPLTVYIDRPEGHYTSLRAWGVSGGSQTFTAKSPAGGGGTSYPLDFSASLTGSAALTKAIAKPLAGVI